VAPQFAILRDSTAVYLDLAGAVWLSGRLSLRRTRFGFFLLPAIFTFSNKLLVAILALFFFGLLFRRFLWHGFSPYGKKPNSKHWMSRLSAAGLE
jgi:hypothetical protein